MQAIIPLGGSSGRASYFASISTPPPITSTPSTPAFEQPHRDHNLEHQVEDAIPDSAEVASEVASAAVVRDRGTMSSSITSGSGTVSAGSTTTPLYSRPYSLKRPHPETSDPMDTASDSSGLPPSHSHYTMSTTSSLSAPVSKRARSTPSRSSGSRATGMSSTSRKAKITTAAAVQGMQGTINRLTDIFEQAIMVPLATTSTDTAQQQQQPEPSMDLVERAAHMLETEDSDLLPHQQAALVTILGMKENERWLKFYVSLTKKDARRPFIERLINESAT